MNKIKFKVYYKGKLFGYEWCDETGWHFYFIKLDTNKEGEILRTHNGIIQNSFFKNHKELIRAQFTGIKDKHGNEIYEGDIIYAAAGATPYRGQIVFHYGSFCLLYGEINSPLCYLFQFEIIGNIYETPELININ